MRSRSDAYIYRYLAIFVLVCACARRIIIAWRCFRVLFSLFPVLEIVRGYSIVSNFEMRFLTVIPILAIILYYVKSQADQTNGQCTGIPTSHLKVGTSGCVNCIAEDCNCYEKCGEICNTPDCTRCSNCVNTTQTCPQLCHDYCAPSPGPPCDVSTGFDYTIATLIGIYLDIS